MLVETVKLSRIVMKLTPELYPSLTSNELESEIVLRFGIEALAAEDVMEIIQFSISEHHKDTLYH
ncbi:MULTISPECIES: hypothetical protein [Paenibacillus]|uniref:Uncharacterized protein n=3 Tax=Paenibacillus TaxID=44249 RepID=A0A1C0ZV29_9BACL|nr:MULTISPECIES: hypothetical protein [Paenibacillus]KRE69922.1 hypothetical protein ASL11_16315 [Paenibacillus sp. Soil750]KRF03842.1 hypothetical protein ASG89_03555 [Paenibacillus sp. Soil766]NOU67302.1 hypothetical protein [Paenibacillus plantarum]NQX61523.1 hypothetical protein [Paenibacillus qinlingensis]OCT11960.1 hypothetical protein A8709_29300 [Paenibacillus pectinilyticus]